MGKKKDCFGREDFVCMTANCPYAKQCITVVWERRMDRVLDRTNKARPVVRRRPRSRLPAEQAKIGKR